MANVSYKGSGISIHTATKTVDPLAEGAEKVCVLDFAGADDKSQFTEVGTSSFTATANAGGAAITVTAGGSKAKLMHTNISGASATNRMQVSCKIKSADVDASNHGIFVGFAEDVTTIANTMAAADGTLRAAANGKDMVGFYKDTSGNLDFYASSGSTEGVNEVDSGFDMADDTFVNLGVEIVGDEISFFRDGVLLKSYTGQHDQAATLFPVIICAAATVVTVDAFAAGM
tara:strand:- start:1582 stop:2271 length:690 start_codon:yes stop_codon:yes gene_type:complete